MDRPLYHSVIIFSNTSTTSFPTGFFVCKLKKISNTIKKDEGDDVEEKDAVYDSGDEDPSQPLRIGNGKDVVKGEQNRMRKRKGAVLKPQEVAPLVSPSKGEPEEEAPKKKRMRGIMKKAIAELQAEKEAAAEKQQTKEIAPANGKATKSKAVGLKKKKKKGA